MPFARKDLNRFGGVSRMDTVMEKKARLGRGLDALIGNGDDNGHSLTQAEAPLDAIERNPYQPRKEFDDTELNALSASIRSHGVLQPLVVRQVGDRYQLVAGERRLRAAKAAGLASVPVRIVDFNDQQVLEAALVENIQRTDLNPIEKAQGFKEYLDRFSMTHDQLAERLGLARSSITNLVAILELPVDVQNMVRVGQLTAGHAKVLKGVPDKERQASLAKEIVARGLSVHAAEAYVKQLLATKADGAPEPSGAEPRTAVEKTAHVLGVENELRQKLSMRVEIKLKAKDKGQIVLGFESNDDFERVLDVLRR
jgi:ParB family transcriptional regulator, chromosome partitioning protein